MNLGDAWRCLGIARTAETGAIRRAYADRLRALDIDRDAADYAQLRAARDTALAWARQQAQRSGGAPPALPEEVEEVRPPLTRWPYAAPDIVGEFNAGSVKAGAEPQPSGPFYALPPRSGQTGELRDLPMPPGWAFGTAALEGQVDPAQEAAAVRFGLRHDIRLHRLLFPEDEASEEAMKADQAAAARDHLDALLEESRHGSLVDHDAVEGWLGRTLASAWPRSAPLVEPAASEFGWEREAGRLGERPEIAFLNARLKGMRFQAKVQERDHPLYKAWKELERPGRRSWLGGIGVKQAEVHKLIEGVRANFPELEHFWDSQRVGSWERLSSGSNEASGPGMWVWWLIGIGIIRLLASAGDSIDGGPASAPYEQVDPVRANAVVAEVFGADRDLAWLRERQPELANTVEANLRMPRQLEQGLAGADEAILGIVRERVDRAGRQLGSSDLDRTLGLRLKLLKAARANSAQTCMDYVRTGRLEWFVKLPASLRQDERAYASALLLAGALQPHIQRQAGDASVPGELIGKVMDATRLGEETVRKALQSEGNDTNLCAVRIALIEAALAYRGKERKELLKVL